MPKVWRDKENMSGHNSFENDFHILTNKVSKSSIGSDSNCSTTSGDNDSVANLPIIHPASLGVTRVRAPSTVWEGVASGPSTPTEAHITAMGAANAAIYQKQVSYNQAVVNESSTSRSSSSNSIVYELNSYASLSTPKDLSSLDCWDYSVELECLQGQDGRAILSSCQLWMVITGQLLLCCTKWPTGPIFQHPVNVSIERYFPIITHHKVWNYHSFVKKEGLKRGKWTPNRNV